jgi:hypothetical protein
MKRASTYIFFIIGLVFLSSAYSIGYIYGVAAQQRADFYAHKSVTLSDGCKFTHSNSQLWCPVDSSQIIPGDIITAIVVAETPKPRKK